VIAAVAAILPLLAAVYACFDRYNSELQAIVYGKDSMFKIGFLLMIAASIGLSLIALGLGFNSAGQRRNEQQQKSWMAFFFGVGVLSLAIITFVAFTTLGHELAQG
jgi:tellurite resistance protein TehA-like permease